MRFYNENIFPKYVCDAKNLKRQEAGHAAGSSRQGWAGTRAMGYGLLAASHCAWSLFLNQLWSLFPKVRGGELALAAAGAYTGNLVCRYVKPGPFAL